MTRPYDYLIVGAGPFGATFARTVTDAGKKCLVIDRRTHIGGNCYSQQRDGIDVHMYGPHIFHTNNEAVWKYVCRFATFNNYRHRTIAHYQGRLYSLPFSLQTLYEFYGDGTPEELLVRLEGDRTHFEHPDNLREQALNSVGSRIYEALIHGYTAKQWGREPEQLPAAIIRRLPVRTNYCVDYFDDKYQGIPVSGYTAMLQNMLDGIQVELDVDYLKARGELGQLAGAASSIPVHSTRFMNIVMAGWSGAIWISSMRNWSVETSKASRLSVTLILKWPGLASRSISTLQRRRQAAKSLGSPRSLRVAQGRTGISGRRR